MTDHHADDDLLRHFLLESAGTIDRLATAVGGVQEGQVARWLRQAVVTADRRDCTPTWLPAVDDIAPELRPVAERLAWKPTWRTTDGGSVIGLASLGEVFDLPSLDVGLMHVAAGASYPEHRHAPNELYLVLSGTGWWRHGGAEDHVEVSAPAILVNPPAAIHGVRCGQEPVTALFVLWE